MSPSSIHRWCTPLGFVSYRNVLGLFFVPTQFRGATYAHHDYEHICHVFVEPNDGTFVAVQMSEDDDGFDECYCGQVRQCDDWVACTQCERWMHLGCTEFDTVEEAEKDDTYKCPRCKNGGVLRAHRKW